MLEIDGPKTGVGAYTDKPFVCITHMYMNHKIIKRGVGAYTEMGAYSREYSTSKRSKIVYPVALHC